MTAWSQLVNLAERPTSMDASQAGSTAVSVLVSPWLRESARDLLLSDGAIAPTDPRAWITPKSYEEMDPRTKGVHFFCSRAV
jgi:hypothetical protein